MYSADAIVKAVLHRDDALIILNKPAGIAVHRTPKGDENIEQYFDALKFGEALPPSLAHRLDKETSGCLVLGRNRKALARLGHLFMQGRVSKRYLALVTAVPSEMSGQISRPIKRVDLGRGKWEFVIADDGQEAVTDYRVIAHSDTHALLSMEPKTGRTHQLRLHCQALGCPILGDRFYGGEREGVERLHLHASHVSIPYDKTPVEAEAPLPEYFEASLASYGLKTV